MSKGRPAAPTPDAQAPVSITTARAPLSADLAHRRNRYLLQMSLRVVCFVGGVLAWGHLPLVVPVALMLAATVLPYVAVVLANAGADGRRPMDPADARTLDQGGPPQGTRHLEDGR